MNLQMSKTQKDESKAIERELLKAVSVSDDALVVTRALASTLGSALGLVKDEKARKSLTRWSMSIAHALSEVENAKEDVIAEFEPGKIPTLAEFRELFNAAIMRSVVETMSERMKDDSDIAWAWQCNLACAYQDEGAEHKQANLAAARFMQLAFKVDVTQFDQWKAFSWA